MCTTYLASKIIDELKSSGIEIVGLPRLIRLNPFARFKTRGNGAVHFKISSENNDINKAKKIVLDNVENLAMFNCDNTNPGVVFYEGEVNNLLLNYSNKAITSFISIEDAENLANEIGAEIHKFKLGRGIIGSLAAIGCCLNDYTYELLTYRVPENYGKQRKIDYNSVIKMDKQTSPHTFENYDESEDYIAIEPKTPCPVLYGIRSNSEEILYEAKNLVKVNEPIERFCIFLTNQHTDMHIQNTDDIVSMRKYSCYKVRGKVKNNPKIIEGGHMFFTLFDDSSEIECGAYEPTKGFRKIVGKLIPGDYIEVYGGIGEHNTFNIEKFRTLNLVDYKYSNPICDCGKRMTSAGKNKGFKCKYCGNKIKSNSKIPEKIHRSLDNDKWYETPVSARRHLAKPLIRFNI